MKFCVVGAGSIGGYVGVKLALAGEDVTLVARGANLEAIRARGMRLTMADGTEYIAPGDQGDREPCRGRSAGRGDPGDEGAPGRAGREGSRITCSTTGR